MEIYVDYYEYDCGQPCTPDGCKGHDTDIPIGITIDGIYLHIWDYPEVNKVDAVKNLIGELCSIIEQTNHEKYIEKNLKYE